MSSRWPTIEWFNASKEAFCNRIGLAGHVKYGSPKKVIDLAKCFERVLYYG